MANVNEWIIRADIPNLPDAARREYLDIIRWLAENGAYDNLSDDNLRAETEEAMREYVYGVIKEGKIPYPTALVEHTADGYEDDWEEEEKTPEGRLWWCVGFFDYGLEAYYHERGEEMKIAASDNEED